MLLRSLLLGILALVLALDASAQVELIQNTNCGPQSEQVTLACSSPIAGEPMGVKLTSPFPNAVGFVIVCPFPANPINRFGCATIYLSQPFSRIPVQTDGLGGHRATFSMIGISPGTALAVQPLLITAGGQIVVGNALRVTVRAPEPTAIHRYVGRVVRPDDHGFTYGYAPSIVRDGTEYHMFFCSGRIIPPLSGDDIRYTHSQDGRIWADPRFALRPSGEIHCCDPSIVYFQGQGDPQPFYYMFYSGLEFGTGFTSIFVARSTVIDGVYHKWTMRNTWEVAPPDPAPIIRPVHQVDGVTQFSAIVRNGLLEGWWTDVSSGSNRVLHASSSSPTAWPVPNTGMLCERVDANGGLAVMLAAETEVKYNPTQQRYIMDLSVLVDAIGTTELHRQWSEDGHVWSRSIIIARTPEVPAYSHNCGVSGNRLGHTISDSNLIVYGSPSNPPGDVRGFWDLHASALNPVGSTWNAIPWGWASPMHRPLDQVLPGDWDGDGNADRCIVDRQSSNWFVIGSRTGTLGLPAIPWGWHWTGMTPTFAIVPGDFDGDLTIDRNIVNTCAAGGQLWYSITSSGSGSWWTHNPFPGSGCPHLPITGDFDGNGVMEPAIVWPQGATGTLWWGATFWADRINVPTFNFIPAVGDYDGDGRTDRAWVDDAVPNSWQRWYCQSSSGQPVFPATGFEWTGAGSLHRVAIGDFDGDGKTDPAIMNQTTGQWYLRTGAPTSIPWGFTPPIAAWNGSARPVVADYDGDGKDDIAVVLPDGGAWGTGRLRWYVFPMEPFRVY